MLSLLIESSRELLLNKEEDSKAFSKWDNLEGNKAKVKNKSKDNNFLSQVDKHINNQVKKILHICDFIRGEKVEKRRVSGVLRKRN